MGLSRALVAATGSGVTGTPANPPDLTTVALEAVPPLNSHYLLVFLLQCAVLLSFALVLGTAAKRIGMPAIVGELLAGVVLGPSLLDHLLPWVANWLFPKSPDQFHLIDALGSFSVVLLVGIAGIQVDLSLIRRRGTTAIRISAAGLLVPLAFGVALGFLLPTSVVAGGGDKTVFALFLGVAMCVSAIPVIAKTLADMRLLHRNIGQLTLAAGMVDDAFGWFMLSVVSAMATTGLRASAVAFALVSLVGVVLVALVVGRPVVRLTMRVAQRSTDPASTTAVIVALLLLAAAGTQALGMEAILGAFLCGVLIGSYPGGPDPIRLAPLRTFVMRVLAPLFFATAGLRMDLTALWRPSVLVVALAIVLVAIAGKFVGAFIGAMTSKLGRYEALALGAGMNSRGVVEVVVAMVGVRLGVLTTTTYTIIVLVAIVTSVMAPPILRWAMAKVESTADEDLRRLEHEDPLLPAEQREAEAVSARPDGLPAHLVADDDAANGPGRRSEPW